MAKHISVSLPKLASVSHASKRKHLASDISRSYNSLYDPGFEHDACGVAAIADITGRRSHAIITQSLIALNNLKHRGSHGFEENTGDGAGIVLQIPHTFFKEETKRLGFALPRQGAYAVGVLFLPKVAKVRKQYEEICEQIITRMKMDVLGYRTVPVNNRSIGMTAKNSEPFIRQIFIAKGKEIRTIKTFERMLYITRRMIENAIAQSDLPYQESFYIPSFSAKTTVYKGMLSSEQIEAYYPDLVNSAFKSAFAIVHQRFSTNTFPSWALAHPFRYLAHNGEINTLRGNKNWMHAREHLFASPKFGKYMKNILPVIQDGSDSSSLDNVLELLIQSGMSLPHALMMLIPEPWLNHKTMSRTKRAFYNYHSSLMEPWDGPALVVCTDGDLVAAVLDRNGLRPARYYVTKNNKVIMASEVGVIPLPPRQILTKGRLRPGRMLLIDTKRKKIIADEELKETIAMQKPYNEWLTKYRIRLEDIPNPRPQKIKTEKDLVQRQQLFGYTVEEQRIILTPMAKTGKEAMGSMGNDTPIAVLSQKPQMLFNYFKQLFAQVTNPPLDAIREELVTSMQVLLGSERNLLRPTAKSCRRIELLSPIISKKDLDKLIAFRKSGFKTKVLPILFPVNKGSKGPQQAMQQLYSEANRAIRNGYTILVLSDKGANRQLAPIPSLLAVAGLHHHLIRSGIREKVSIIVSCGDARDIHHFATLIGYGASAINPYLALATIRQMINDDIISLDKEVAMQNYMKAASDGILKVMSKMGISTLNAYRGAQVFEAIGLNKTVIDMYFTNTSSRIGGVGLEEIAREVLLRHEQAFTRRVVNKREIDIGGEYQWRRGGRRHLYSPEVIAKLQHATRTNQYSTFKEYTELVDNLSKNQATLRGLFALKKKRKPIPLSEVESKEKIIRRFTTGAMSFGSLSPEAHETIAIAMNRLGGKSNTGEGGEDPARNIPDDNGDLRRSAIKQVASGRFGVTSEYLVNASEIQIKMAQGAKPGEGGQLPGEKVYPWIAKVRHTVAGVGLISPPPHHDIYSIEDLCQLIYDLKNANPTARISVKLAAEVGVGTVAAGVAKAFSDAVIISGHEGGTGAAPMTSIKSTGIPWEIGLAETQQVLMKNGLRSRIVVQTDGHLKTGRDVIIAALLGAEEYGFATAPLVVLGCVMMRVCHLDTCPVGIATQNPELRKRFTGQPEHLINFFTFLAEEVREYMAQLGFRTMDEMIGKVEMLDFQPALSHWKAKGLDLTPLLHMPTDSTAPRRCIVKQNHGLRKVLDHQLIKLSRNTLRHPKRIRKTFRIKNTDRTVGTMLGYEITKRYGDKGLADDTIRLTFTGSAGQSFGAFIPKGLTMVLQGDGNDHVGKGLSGGKIIVYPINNKRFIPEENIIIGNVALYGATSGEAYINGIAGERFAVRNSGAVAVVEGVGDHGCEYMTGGTAVILGEVGRNFAAGMSGGVAYILDNANLIKQNYNSAMVELEKITSEDENILQSLITRHQRFTKSPKAETILQNWDEFKRYFVKVIPKEYKQMEKTNQSESGETSQIYKQIEKDSVKSFKAKE
ncbi:MAG TPA: glutamate synthase large subunit [Candidatus Acidoferrales bacterium]|nr:glutamate synthase large subunit [Candidatus Acidoferrales bacterium]